MHTQAEIVRRDFGGAYPHIPSSHKCVGIQRPSSDLTYRYSSCAGANIPQTTCRVHIRLCRSAQTPHWPRVMIICAAGKIAVGTNTLLIVGGVMALIAFVIIPAVRVWSAASSTTFGWMSQQWLVEHRNSH